MNIENNKRFVETEKKILRAYGKLAKDKPLSKITVSDICKEANIHRTTFYGHYEDIIALQYKVGYHQLQDFIQNFMKDGTWNLEDGLLKQLIFYRDHKNIIKNHLNNADDFIFSVYDSSSIFSDENYKKHYQCDDDIDLKYHRLFFQAGFTAILREWLLSDCSESPEKITKILMKIYA